MKTARGMKLLAREQGYCSRKVGELPVGCWMGRGWERVSEGAAASKDRELSSHCSIHLGLNLGSTISGKSPHSVEPYFSHQQNGDVNTFAIIFLGEHSMNVCGCSQMGRSGTQQRFNTHRFPSLFHPGALLFIPGTWLLSLLCSSQSSWEDKQEKVKSLTVPTVGDFLGVELKTLWAKLFRR